MNTPYLHSKIIHNKISAIEVVPLLIQKFNPKSVIDIGCGLGDWLNIFQQNGVENILGVDGSWVNKSDLYIDKRLFQETDLAQSFRLDRKFDLAMSLEVAEHLPESAADTFIDTLTNLSDKIIFSAAIPNQGGQNHINEQWHSYWIEKFESRGFHCHDIIRPLIWENEKIAWWYRQNVFFFSKNSSEQILFVNTLHPDLLQDKMHHIQNIYDGKMGVKIALKTLIKAIKNTLKR
jgi:SAM-dependent methyltransferase